TSAAPSPPARATRGAARFGVASLFFDYDGHRLAPYAGDAQARVVQGEEILEISRDPARGRRAEARHEPLGLVAAVLWSYDTTLQHRSFRANQYVLRPEPHKPPLSPEAWTLALGELAAAGFRIEYEADFPRDDVVEIEAWHADLD